MREEDGRDEGGGRRMREEGRRDEGAGREE